MKRPGEPAEGIAPPAWAERANPVIFAETSTRHKPGQATATRQQLADVWRVVVLNDPVNLMSYVVMVFKKVLGFDEMKIGRAHV